MAKYSKNDIIRIVDEEDIEFIRLQFTDIFGTLKNVAITASQLEKALDNKCMFDGSSIEGFVRIEESDMYLHPDLDTFMIFPWRPQQGKVARIICDVYMADGTPFEGDPRYILKKQIEKAKQMGYIFNVGPECEFFLFHLDENGQPIYDFCEAEDGRLSEAAEEFVNRHIKCGEDLSEDEQALAAAMMLSSCCKYFKNICEKLSDGGDK